MTKNKFSFLIAFMLFFFDQAIAQINIDFDRYEDYLADKKYDKLISETHDIRWSQEYGKNWWIDYYMAMGYCGKGDRQAANYAFEYIVRSYKDALDINELIFASRNSCGNQTVPVDNRFEEIIGFVKSNWNAEGGRVSRVSGKLGYVMDCNQDVELYEFNPDFDYTELSKRLFSISEPQKAIEYYNDFLPEGKYDVEAAGRFIIITLADKDIDPLRIIKVGSELEKIYQFFVNFYSVRPPDKLITVYLMGTKSNLQQVAKDTHGLTIPKNNYGYSNIADLSILGNSSPEGIGTMAHELFHLIIRADIGDIPGWLDEGIACLYEESKWEGDQLVSRDMVWRTGVLKFNNDTDRPLPLLINLIDNNWSEFTPNNATTICELSVNYAMAKHFAMYMEDIGVLQKVVYAFKQRKNVFLDPSIENVSPVQILEDTLNQNLGEIQIAFDTWLNEKYNITTKRDTDYIIQKLEMIQELGYMCNDDDPKCQQFREDYQILRGEIDRQSGSLSPKQLSDCINLISLGDELYLKYQ